MQRSKFLPSSILISVGVCAGLALGCAAGGGTTGTGGQNSGTGGGSNPGTGGGSNPGTGGGSNPGTGGGSNPGTGGGSNPGTGGRSNPGTGGAIGGTGGIVGGTGGIVGGSGGAGGGVVAGNPAGYYTMGTFHGCTWTGVDTLAKGTTNTPVDFVSQTPVGFPYCVSGSVGADPINSATVALLGFDLNEAPNGVSTQCKSNPSAPAPVLPTVNVTTAGANPPGGIAISYLRMKGSNIRVQLQGPTGGTNANDRWCATITQVQGPVFLPFRAFNTACYNNSGSFYAGQPLSEISLLVPGTTGPSPFSYCVGGFAMGSTVTSAAAAPAYNPPTYPILTGTIGGPDPSGGDFIDLQRVKVAAPGVNGKAYIIQNNNWGSPTTSEQTISYSANTFTVVSSTSNTTGVGIPGSFPSIYIGANGQTAGQLPGVLATTPDGDGLPKAISAITSMPSTFTYNKATGDYNATYDIWVSSVQAPALGYKTAQSGFVMVWLYRPPNRSPISATGTAVRTATIGGVAYSVFVGPRNEAGGDGTSRPVVSYVANTTMLSTPANFDLKPFLADAAMNGIPNNWAVTDVFAGFEIWTGSTAAGLSETAFSIAVN